MTIDKLKKVLKKTSLGGWFIVREIYVCNPFDTYLPYSRAEIDEMLLVANQARGDFCFDSH